MPIVRRIPAFFCCSVLVALFLSLPFVGSAHAQETFGVGLIVAAAALHAGNALVVQTVGARAALDGDVALVELEAHFAGYGLLRVADEGQ